MIELFSRSLFGLEDEDHHFNSIHIDDEVSSLSAILLNNVYYQILLDGRTEVNGLVILEPIYMIPFKAKAWIDLTDKRNKGVRVDERDIKKHKNDIIRLAMLLDGNDIVQLPEEVRIDMEYFLNQYEKELVDLKSLRIRDITNAEIIRRLREVYCLKMN